MICGRGGLVAHLGTNDLREVEKRIALRGREQDSPEIFEERWKIYQDNRDKIIAPLLGSGVGFSVLDGVGTPEEVYERALSMMKNEVIRSES